MEGMIIEDLRICQPNMLFADMRSPPAMRPQSSLNLWTVRKIAPRRVVADRRAAFTAGTVVYPTLPL